MKVDNVELSETARLRMLIMEEAEGELSPPLDPLRDEVDKLLAVDLIEKMRKVRELTPRWPETTRAQYEKRFEALSLEAAAAAAWLRRHRSDDAFVPEFLRMVGEL